MDSFLLKGKTHTYLVYRLVYEPVASNMYAILKNNVALVLDPHQSDDLVDLLEKEQIERVNILLTHEHYDHTSGLRWLYDLYPSKIYCQKACAQTIAVKRKNNPALIAMVLADKDKKDGGNRYETFKKQFVPYACEADYTFEDSVIWDIDGIEVKGVATPGHSPGSAFYFIDDMLAFSGDTLLKDFPVITRFRTSNPEDYEKKTLPYLKQLNPNLILIPGHGNPFEEREAQYIKYNV